MVYWRLKFLALIIVLSISEILHCKDSNPSDSLFILKTEQFSNYNKTYVGNGYFSLVSTPLGITAGESYMVWIYDHGKDDVPRICLLPGWNEINIFNGSKWLGNEKIDTVNFKHYKQELDLYRGVLKTSYRWESSGKVMDVKSEVFVHREDKNLAVLKLEITPYFSGEIKLSFPIKIPKTIDRLKLELIDRLEPWPGHWKVWYPGIMIPLDREVDLENKIVKISAQAEGRETKVGIAVAISSEPKRVKTVGVNINDSLLIYLSFKASKGKTYRFFKFIGIVSSFETPAFLDSAKAIALRARNVGYNALFKTHSRKWEDIWETDIIVDDPELQLVIRSMIFYLLCSVREGTDFSIPPMGLSSPGYYGHIFWDADTWMFPAILLMHPEFSRSIVMFRYKALEKAKKKARMYGYTGAMYPWESDELGEETTPKFAWQNALYEIHITGDVAFAQWQYFLATSDTNWLKEYGSRVILETANFWSNRAVYNKEKDKYEIRNVVSVDEGLIGINNDAYTNSIAKRNLEIAIKVCKILNVEKDPTWEIIKDKIYIPYDSIHDYNPTYENAPTEIQGSVVPLLSYPLELGISQSTKRNNLKLAVERVKKQGPGGMMGITLYPIVAIELGDKNLFEFLFPLSYKPYLRPPFNVLAETPDNDAINFLTGAGGFLQQVIFGWTGLRLTENGLEPKYKPMLPSNVRRLALKNFKFRNKKYDIYVEDGVLTINSKDY